jgi:hypothetical protein
MYYRHAPTRAQLVAYRGFNEQQIIVKMGYYRYERARAAIDSRCAGSASEHEAEAKNIKDTQWKP